MKASDVVTYQGKRVNRLTLAILVAANTILRESPRYGRERADVTLTQGGYNRGGVSASAGTHDDGAVGDTTPFNIENRVMVFRLLGTSLNERKYLAYVWPHHGHFTVIGDGTGSPANRAQQAEFLAGGDGLRGNLRDPDWRPDGLPILFVAPWDARGKPGVRWLKGPSNLRAEPSLSPGSKVVGHAAAGAKFTVVAVVNARGTLWAVNPHGDFVRTSYLTTTRPGSTPAPARPARFGGDRLRAMTYNPSDKLGNTDARAARVASEILAADVSLVGLQESGGTLPKVASPWARLILRHLGEGWAAYLPSTPLNENYLLYRLADWAVHRSVPDRVVRVEGAPGRHLTSALLRHVPDGDLLLAGVTHLADKVDDAASERQADAVSSALLTSRDALERDRRRPVDVLLAGDLNYDRFPSAWAADGLADAFAVAAATTNAGLKTFLGNTAPLTAAPAKGAPIDYVAVERSRATVHGATTVVTPTPRGGDHLPRVVSVSFRGR